jgi:hypothetical protein
MNTETNKSNSPPMEEPLQNDKSFLKRKVNYYNEVFNTLSSKTKKASMIVFGISMAGICTILILQAIYGQANTSLPIDEITLPNDIYMNAPNTEKLTPIGKMKGELDGKFEAFHVAVDSEGQLFINRDPEYSKDSLNKSKGWEPTTRQQLETYEKQLHFIPAQKKGLKR